MAAGKYLVLLVVAFLFSGCDGFPNGAPAAACVSLRPGHFDNNTAVNPQTSPSPYSIVVQNGTYAPGKTFTVQIVGPVFRGFLLQARRPGMTTPVGTFSSAPTDTKTTQCTTADSSMTHANPNPKENITLTWNAPSAGVGNVEFVATVAEVKVRYWMGIKSSVVTQGSGAIFVTPTYYVIILCLVQSAYMTLK